MVGDHFSCLKFDPAKALPVDCKLSGGALVPRVSALWKADTSKSNASSHILLLTVGEVLKLSTPNFSHLFLPTLHNQLWVPFLDSFSNFMHPGSYCFVHLFFRFGGFMWIWSLSLWLEVGTLCFQWLLYVRYSYLPLLHIILWLLVCMYVYVASLHSFLGWLSSVCQLLIHGNA